MKPLLVISTFPNKEEANSMASRLLEKRLVACAQIQAEMLSIYRWQGDIEQANEVALHLKTTDNCWPEIEREIKDNHSYEVPEIIAIPIVTISADYAAWLNEQLQR